MPKKRIATIDVRESDIAAVPLKCGGFGRIVVARYSSKDGAVLGYCFGPRFQEIADMSNSRLRADDRVAVLLLGDMGLVTGEWPIVGRVFPWDRGEWPQPEFYRNGRGVVPSMLITRSERDLLMVVSSRVCDENVKNPPDALYGHGAVECELSDILCT